MELVIFARFHTRTGRRRSVEPRAGLREHRNLPADAGPRLFFIHSCWRDEAAFEIHAGLPHTVRSWSGSHR